MCIVLCIFTLHPPSVFQYQLSYMSECDTWKWSNHVEVFFLSPNLTRANYIVLSASLVAGGHSWRSNTDHFLRRIVSYFCHSKMSRLMMLAGVVLLVCVITTCSAVPHTRESRNNNQATTLLQDTNLRDKVLEADAQWWHMPVYIAIGF